MAARKRKRHGPTKSALVFTITTTVDCYLLPGDGQQAESVFLQHVKDPHEMWIIAYSFTLIPMIDEILANNSSGAPYHIYLDLSQSSGKYEKPEIQKLVDAGVEVTVGTSPAGTAYITHTKGLVCDDAPPLCWEGSVNFSASGWLQVNTAMVFHSQQWRDEFVKQFDALRDYAWTNLRGSQLMSAPPPGVTIGPSVDTSAPAVPVEWKSSKKKTSKSKKASPKAESASRISKKKTPAAKKKPTTPRVKTKKPKKAKRS